MLNWTYALSLKLKSNPKSSQSPSLAAHKTRHIIHLFNHNATIHLQLTTFDRSMPQYSWQVQSILLTNSPTTEFTHRTRQTTIITSAPPSTFVFLDTIHIFLKYTTSKKHVDLDSLTHKQKRQTNSVSVRLPSRQNESRDITLYIGLSRDWVLTCATVTVSIQNCNPSKLQRRSSDESNNKTQIHRAAKVDYDW